MALQKVFQPQPDITAYELARIAPYLTGSFTVVLSDKEWNNLPNVLQRHFLDGPAVKTGPPDQNGVRLNLG